MNRKIYVATAILVIIAAALGWYYFVYTKTPEYSLKMIGEAVNTHDVNKFKKHVDLDSVVSRAVDDFADYSLKKLKEDSNGNELSNALVDGLGRGLFMAVKPEINNSLKKKIISAVETGEWKTETGKNKLSREEKEAEKSAESMGFENAKYSGVIHIEKKGAIAKVWVDVSVSGLEKPFTLELKMRKLEDGMWQVSEIENYMDYIIVIAKLRKDEMDRYALRVRKLRYDYRIKRLRHIHDHGREESSEESDKAFFLNELEKIEKLKEIPVPDGAKELGDLIQEYAQLYTKVQECYEPGTCIVKKDSKTQRTYRALKDKIRENEKLQEGILKEYEEKNKEKARSLILGSWKSEDGKVIRINDSNFGYTYKAKEFFEEDGKLTVVVYVYSHGGMPGGFPKNMIFSKENTDEMTLLDPLTNYVKTYRRSG